MSGGKDSTAMALFALEYCEKHNIEFPDMVFADTGNENPITMEYLDFLDGFFEKKTGKKIERVKLDFSAQMARKIEFIKKHWKEDLMSGKARDNALSEEEADSVVAVAINNLKPSGIPFLDLCMVKGRFPSTRARFCSIELKHIAIYAHVFEPALENGDLVSWQGVRADESHARRNLPEFELDDKGYYVFRPVLSWDYEKVFEQHKKHGVEPNPLYKMGMMRVGCSPCIHSVKNEILAWSDRFPGEVDKIDSWEKKVGLVSKSGQVVCSFFRKDKTPGDHRSKREVYSPRIRDVIRWAKTGRGGKTFDMFKISGDFASCASFYGLCE